ncbi:pilus assembly protein [Marichromatium sp. AB32]|uniref:pilus assembly protein n=1 Tax=Marichromatium sp. AB32 TaxID=2483363 RepID=UPI0011CE909C|nr:PilC/PilY family type IV pilus protein [Marichromatium sp. AB32]
MHTELENHIRRSAARIKLTLATLLISQLACADMVSQIPLSVGTNVPGNLALVPSVEWPTINSVANLGAYTEDRAYAGYFDSNKCYRYEGIDSAEEERHFYPSSTTNNRRCSGDGEWSGNFMNWAATQTIDPFRAALSGGYRYRDTVEETWLQKARHDGQGGTNVYPERRTPQSGSNASLISGATPFEADWINIRINGLGNRMYFTLPNDFSSTSDTQTSQQVFDDSDFSSGWIQYRNGEVSRDSSRSVDAITGSLRKTDSNDPNGGYKTMSQTVDRNFIFTGWIYRPSNSGGGNADRLSISDSDFDGYGVVFTSTQFGIEKRSDGNPSSLGSRQSWNRPENEWYRFVLTSYDDGEISLEVYDDRNQQLGSISGITDSSYSSFDRIVIHGGHTYYVDNLSVSTTDSDIPYPLKSSDSQSSTFEAHVRVKVCDPSVSLEDNCVRYGSHYKPEGLLQEYSSRIRYAVFGYLNDSNKYRDGGVLRAGMRFIGENMIDDSGLTIENPNPEWDLATGVLTPNPTPSDITSTLIAAGVEDSGVINYLNKFGEMTSANHKSIDPVSELFYAALRYFKHQGNVPEYSDISGSDDQKYQLADGFPVITSWQDPIQHYCQKSVILGIGDANTHRDKNLPGNSRSSDEPATPSEVSGDSSIDVVTATQRVALLEGITISTPFTGRENSAYIVGLAYDAHTRDIRPDLIDKQTVSTYWVDVREAQRLESRARNQYWLATKYGGFSVPNDYRTYEQTEPLPDSWWHTTGDILSTGDKRPDNFYVASEADKMIESLTQAFSNIVEETVGTGSGLATNSSELSTDTRSYQASFVSGSWDGDVEAFSMDTQTGVLSETPEWSANDALPAWDARKIFFNRPDSQTAEPFTWDNLSGAQQALLQSSSIVDYLRGDTSNETPSGTLRSRQHLLGDIVNSAPVHVSSPDPSFYVGATFLGASSYANFSRNQQSRSATLYVGANDGMLHAFDAATGEEIYAFIPNAVFSKGLVSLANPDYAHRYFVDGELTVADVYTSGAWKSVLIGTLGRGGPGVFALDVTDPTNISLLWERDEQDIPGLGRNIGKPIVAQVEDGEWRVLLGNGPDNQSGTAQLLMIDVADGSAVSVEPTTVTDNALSAIYAWDSNGDGFTDTVYAGDLKGNLWRFENLSSNTPQSRLLFSATDASNTSQPITVSPLVGVDPDSDLRWVFFGTGRYLNETDITDTQVQSWYGLVDEGQTISSRSNLVARQIEAEGLVDELSVRVVSAGDSEDLEGKSGWYIDLVSPINGREGERMTLPNQFQGEVLFGTTRIPDSSDSCQPTGNGFVMAIDPFTGARLSEGIFDIDRDGEFDQSDALEVSGEPIPVSGVGFSHVPNQPTFVANFMQVVLDNSDTETIQIRAPESSINRASWREILEY